MRCALNRAAGTYCRFCLSSPMQKSISTSKQTDPEVASGLRGHRSAAPQKLRHSTGTISNVPRARRQPEKPPARPCGIGEYALPLRTPCAPKTPEKRAAARRRDVAAHVCPGRGIKTAASKKAPFTPESGSSCQNRCAFACLAANAGALRQNPSPQVGNAAYPARFIEKL